MSTNQQTRPYNFGAGPAMLPDELLMEVQAELLDWRGSGMSVMEVGARTPLFMELMTQLQADFRSILNIPDDYQLLFLSSPARMQFAQIALNFLNKTALAGYLISGVWSAAAFIEAKRLYPNVYSVAHSSAHLKPNTPFQFDASQQLYFTVPEPKLWELKSDSAYVYYTPNETVNGVRFPFVPATGKIPLIADMTSCILSEPIDINQYQLIFAGAQKNLALAGFTVVIIKKELLHRVQSGLPAMLDYAVQSEFNSMYATPPTFDCYMAAKMLEWIKRQGGLTVLAKRNKEKASKLYDYIDASDFYQSKVAIQARSLMNVCFSLPTIALEEKFIDDARQHSLLALKGHRLVGGIRASLYNAMPLAGVEKLIAFMQHFASQH